MEHRLRRKGFENTIFCIAVIELACTVKIYLMYQLNFQVHGKRFVYKFVCDLKQLIGYSAAELSRLVAEAEAKFFGHKVKI